jgi:hypothetical protein
LYNFYAQFVKDAETFEMEKSGGQHPEFSVRSSRDAAADVITELNDTYSPNFTGRYVFDAKINTLDDQLATPQSWSCETRIIRGRDEEPFMNTLHRWKGSFIDGIISYESGDYRLLKDQVEGKLSWKWGIIDLVQGMAKDSVDELHFSALDEMDMLYEHQFARYRKKVNVECGLGEVEFSVFDVLGDDIIPTVYWVDDQHRVAFIISGVEAYMIL